MDPNPDVWVDVSRLGLPGRRRLPPAAERLYIDWRFFGKTHRQAIEEVRRSGVFQEPCDRCGSEQPAEWLSVTPDVRTPPRRRRNRITAQLLTEVAQVYRGAFVAGDPPTRAVADHFRVSHSTAAKWVGRARRQGALGPTDGSRGGER